MAMQICFRIAFILALTLSTPAWAEYRVFLLEITTHSSEGGESENKRTFTSTLDPDQYRGYYPVQANQSVKYLDTWLCRGRTGGFKPHCPNPKDQSTSNEGQDLEGN